MENVSSNTKPIKVLFVIDSFRMGGAEKITASLLTRFDQNNIVPVLCTLNNKDESPKLLEPVHQAKIATHNLGITRLISRKVIHKLRKIIQDEKIQLIHAQLQDSNILSAIAGKFSGIPVISTRHLIGDPDNTWRLKLRNWLERFLTRTCMAYLIGVSDSARENYIHLSGISPHKSGTIYNGIDIDRFHEPIKTRELKKELGISENTPIIALVSVLRPGKGHHTAIKAMGFINNAHLLIVGNGPPTFTSNLKKFAYDLRERIHFLGEQLDIPEILANCDLVILPSEYEALPTVLIEAGAAVKPAITCNVGGCSEVIQDGETGFLIQPNDHQELANKVIFLLSNESLSKHMAQKAYINVKNKFSVTRQIRELSELYIKLLDAK
ncbi:MAG: glycosyltransferase family 4 protein [Desulfotalea sp.]